MTNYKQGLLEPRVWQGLTLTQSTGWLLFISDSLEKLAERRLLSGCEEEPCGKLYNWNRGTL